MRILYLIFVLCVVALLFTALAAARHIRRHEEKRKSALEEKTDEKSDASVAMTSAAEAPQIEVPKTEVLVAAGKHHES
jgi:hypothetical protein